MTELDVLKHKEEAPEWMTEKGFTIINKGYLLENETPKQAYMRVAKASANRLEKPELIDKFFELLWKSWLGLASPVFINMGTDRGLSISCFSSFTQDDMYAINQTATEISMLSKYGGGTSEYLGEIRPAGSLIRNGQNGKSDGVVPFVKVRDSVILASKQGSARRGAYAAYLPITHGDFEKFLKIRLPEGDVNKQCLNIHHGVCIDDEFMKSLSFDRDNQAKFLSVIKTRLKSGEPYIFYTDNVNNANPQVYKDKKLKVHGSNLCCVAGETKIYTDKGNIEISKLVNQTINVWDGEQFSEVLPQETGVDTLYNIKFSDGSEINCTSNHKFLIQNNYWGNYQLKELKDVELGDKLIKFDLPKIDFDRKLKEVDAYSQGFYSADGNKNRVFSWVYEPKKDVINFLEGTVEKDFDINNKKRWTHGKMLSKDFVPIGYSNECKIKWLSGLLDGDGCVIQNKVGGVNTKGQGLQLASIDRNFLMNLKEMLTELGVKSKVIFAKKEQMTLLPDGKGGKKEYKTKEIHRILIPSSETKKLVFCGLDTKRLKINSNPQRDASKKIKVISIKKTDRTEMTYCFKNENNGLGTFNGILTGNSEITGFTDEKHTFVCCLSSMNLFKFDEWKDTDAVYYATWFLDGVMQEFIDKAKKIKGFERTVAFAEKSRMLGLGVFGFHSYLQKKMIDFESLQAKLHNKVIFKHIKEQAYKASADMAKELGEPPLMKGYGMRNSHLIALAPTTTNAKISGDRHCQSPTIEPMASNAQVEDLSQGTFLVKNELLVDELEKLGLNTPKIWKSIVESGGSIQHIPEIPDELKKVFKTAREINQFKVIELAADRQEFIDQAQSLNLFFSADADPQYIVDVHRKAWELGVKTLYYLRSSGVNKADSTSREYERKNLTSKELQEECVSCEG